MPPIPTVDDLINQGQNLGGRIQTTVNKAAPLTTTYSSPDVGMHVGQVNAISNPAGQGVMPAFWNKLENVGKEIGHLAVGAVQWTGQQMVHFVEAPVKLGVGIAHLGLDKYTSQDLSNQQNALDQRQQSIMSQYKSGKLSSKAYSTALKSLAQDRASLGTQLNANVSNLENDQKAIAQATIDTAATVLTILTAGAYAPLGTGAEDYGAKLAADYLAKQAPATVMDAATSVLSKATTSEAFFKALPEVAQNAIVKATSEVTAQAAASMSGAEIAKATASNLILKAPLTYNAIVGSADSVYKDLQDKRYGAAVETLAFNIALAFSGGPVGKALEGGGKILGTISDAMFGQQSIIDGLSRRIGDGNPLKLYNILQDELAKGNEQKVKDMIVMLDTNLKAEHGNVGATINRITDHLENFSGWGDLTTQTHQAVLDDLTNWAKHAQAIDTPEFKVAAGLSANDPRHVVPGRWIIPDKQKVATVATGADKMAGSANFDDIVQARLSAYQALKENAPGAAWANNANLDKQLTTMMSTIEPPAELYDSITSIPAQAGLKGVPSQYAEAMAKDGFIAIVPEHVSAPIVQFGDTSGKLLTSAENGGKFFEQTAAPLPVLGSVGKLLTTMGLSPQSSGEKVFDLFNQNFADSLPKIEGIDIPRGDTTESVAQNIMGKLSNYAKSRRVPITDYRQMTTKDIESALGVSTSTARQVKGSLMDSMLAVPTQVRGLGDKIMDINYKVNPLAGRYARVQAALRFTYNPFFEAKVAAKTEFIVQFETQGKFPTMVGTNKLLKFIFPNKYAELDGITATLEQKGVYGIAKGLTGEAADTAGVGAGVVGHDLLDSQKRSLAGLIGTMADTAGMDVPSFVDAHPQETIDAIKTVVSYNPNGNFINSPLARTINYAFFPFRFEMKVAGIMAQSIGRMSPVTQFAVVKGLLNTGSFLRSPEGQAWYSNNSDVIGIMKYFTPLTTIAAVSQILGQKPDAVSQYGELGGLPFGWIPAMLSAQGIDKQLGINFNQAYVNPGTGQELPDYIPTGTKGKLNAAIQDLLGQLFAYPGATVGLPSKGSVERTVAGGIIPGSSKDFTAQPGGPLTPQQQSFQKTVQGLPQNQTTNQTTNPNPAQTPSTSIKVPTQAVTPAVYKPKGAAKTTKLKKSQFKPTPIGD